MWTVSLFTHFSLLDLLKVPVDPSLVICVAATRDAYVPREGTNDIRDVWPGCEVRYIDCGHITGFVFKQHQFRWRFLFSIFRWGYITKRRELIFLFFVCLFFSIWSGKRLQTHSTEPQWSTSLTDCLTMIPRRRHVIIWHNNNNINKWNSPQFGSAIRNIFMYWFFIDPRNETDRLETWRQLTLRSPSLWKRKKTGEKKYRLCRVCVNIIIDMCHKEKFPKRCAMWTWKAEVDYESKYWMKIQLGENTSLPLFTETFFCWEWSHVRYQREVSADGGSFASERFVDCDDDDEDDW